MFQDRIREYYDALTPGFRALADFIMTHTLDAAFLTAREMARRVDVDPATVVRFSQEIGYSGYRELSREIKAYVRDQITATYREATEAKSEEELLNAILDNTQEQLERFRTTEIANLASAVKALKEASHIWVTGEFTSQDLGGFLAKSFYPTLGIPASLFHPSIAETAATVAQMQPGDVVLAICVGIAGLDTGYALRLANEKDVTTICIANSGTVLPAREADITIVAPTKSPVGVASFNLSLLLVAIFWEAMLGSQDHAENFTNVYTNMSELLDHRSQAEDYDIPDIPVTEMDES